MVEWERQPKETAEAHAAMMAYLEMGATRSTAKVQQKVSKSKRWVDEWSRRWAWVERARAYDAHMARIAQEAREEAERVEAVKWAERQAKLRESEWDAAEALREKALRMLRLPLTVEKIDKDGQTIVIAPAKWRMEDAAKFLDTSSKLARLAAEMETERAAHTIDFKRKTDAELAEFIAARIRGIGGGTGGSGTPEAADN